MERTITLVMYHGGRLVIAEDQATFQYCGGEMCVWNDIDCDTLNIFGIENMCKTHGYQKFEKIWWRNPHTEATFELRQLLVDSDILDICIASRHGDDEIDIFFQHYETEPLTLIPYHGVGSDAEGTCG